MARRLVVRNLWRKVVALLVAIALWYLFGGQRVTERTLRVPVQVTNAARTVEAAIVVPDTVEVRVRGPRTLMARLTGPLSVVDDLARLPAGQRPLSVKSAAPAGTGGVAAFVDLAGVPGGFRMLPIRVQVPDGVSLIAVDPAEASVQLR